MRITYSSLLYPTVNVKITNETDDNNEYYNKFMHYWESLYENKKHFHFFMDLKSLTRPNLGLCIDFINRQKKLKESPIQYLDYSMNQQNLVESYSYTSWTYSEYSHKCLDLSFRTKGVALEEEY